MPRADHTLIMVLAVAALPRVAAHDVILDDAHVLRRGSPDLICGSGGCLATVDVLDHGACAC